VTSINLDEYAGLAPGNPQSYRYFMDRNLFDNINIPYENTHVPDGLAPDPAGECARYDELITRCGGIDLQLLGIGHNGHIGLNEPADSFAVGTHRVELAPRTIEANRRFFQSEAQVPKHAYTVGVSTILGARKIVLAVSGADKADIVARALGGPVTPQVPASALQLHGNVTVVGDGAALAKLDVGG